MVADNSQSMSVSWSPYGKILSTSKAGGANLQFSYNAMQQRVVKRVSQNGDTTRTYYIRDAQGNTMGVYSRHNDSVSWREQYIFGSSRLGLYRADTLVNKGLLSISKIYEGKKNYELTNHLGNVLAVINDRKTDSLNGAIKLGFNAVVISATDYYPFGMGIDSRSYTSSLYRYGFNGKENDKETGEQDYGMRIYDPRIAKFLSVDPISYKYPFLTPYQFASNSPIASIDIDGLESNNSFNIVENYKNSLKESAFQLGCTLYYQQYNSKKLKNTFSEPLGNKKFEQIRYTITSYNSKAPMSYQQSIIHIVSDADIDNDGGRHAYTKDDKPINGIVPKDKLANIKKSDIIGAFPDGFLKTETSFKDANGQSLDAESVPYIALPDNMMKSKDNKFGIAKGDLVYMLNPKTGIGIYGIVGDASGTKMGEISDFAHTKLNPGDGLIHYFVIPGTSSTNPADLTNSAIQERGQKKFDPVNNSRDRQILDDSIKQKKQNK